MTHLYHISTRGGGASSFLVLRVISYDQFLRDFD